MSMHAYMHVYGELFHVCIGLCLNTDARDVFADMAPELQLSCLRCLTLYQVLAPRNEFKVHFLEGRLLVA